MNTPLTIAILVAGISIGAFGNSYPYQPLHVPKADEVVLFTNGLPPGTGEQSLKKKEDILKFLRRGKNNLDVSSWYDLESARRPKTISICEGVFTTKSGKIISLAEIVRTDSSLFELSKLPGGWHAWRHAVEEPWIREPLDDSTPTI